jgi:histidinol-phosphate aminotransferase
VWPSDANFLLVLFRDLPAARACLDSRRILIRDFSAAPGLHNCARVTVGSPSENDLLLDTLEEMSATYA